jgi:uncharacterized membrane protein
VPVLLAITAPSATTIMAVDHLLLPHLLGISRSLHHVPAWRETQRANWPAICSLLIATGYGTVASAILPGHVLYATTRNWGPVPLESWLLAGALYVLIVTALHRRADAHHLIAIPHEAEAPVLAYAGGRSSPHN